METDTSKITLKDIPVIAITMGDPAGIGPEIILKSLSEPSGHHIPLIIGDSTVLKETAYRLNLSSVFDSLSADNSIVDLANVSPRSDVGIETSATGRASAEYIREAVRLWKHGRVHAVATAPISKKALSMGGYNYPGHTEFLAELTGTSQYAMSFFAQKLRVVLLSTHISLRDAIERVTVANLVPLIKFSDRSLTDLLGREVSIAVAGLNPHASEGGMFGSEEASQITPAIQECKAAGIRVSGPYSPDTIFLRGFRGEFDAVISCYHDQATIAVKSLSFGSAVNVTLGLPLIRTSVDHGTAFDIAGKGIADASSMAAAIKLAAELALSKHSSFQGTL